MAYTVLSQDTGTSNCGFSVARYTKTSITFLEIGQIVSTIRNLTDDTQYINPTKKERADAKKKGIHVFRKEDKKSNPAFHESFPRYYSIIDDLRVSYKVSDVIAERFQTRGNGGPLIELVSTMNGALVSNAYAHNVTYRLITASQWKNQVNKYNDLEALYLYTHSLGYTPHETDATLIGLYQAAYRGVLDFVQGIALWKKAVEKYMG